MERRKEDPVIIAIHERLDKLEDISATLARIEDWIATVTKVTRLLEIVGCFIEKWSIRFLKIGAVLGMVWASFKIGITDIKDFIRWILFK